MAKSFKIAGHRFGASLGAGKGGTKALILYWRTDVARRSRTGARHAR